MNISFDKIVHEVERDIRNQVLIEQMKKITLKGKIMVFIDRYWPPVVGILLFIFLWFILCASLVLADELPQALKVPCPTSEPCKVVVLSQSEESLLMKQNGILDTAAQARAIDLGQFAVYFKQKIASAPEGQVQTPPAKHDAPPENKPAAPVDKSKK
jgi:hypothetical protein